MSHGIEGRRVKVRPSPGWASSGRLTHINNVAQPMADSDIRVWKTPYQGHQANVREDIMTVAKVIEINSESEKSFEDAIQQGIVKAGKTVKNIQSAWVKEQKVTVKDGKIGKYRVDLKVTFVLD